MTFKILTRFGGIFSSAFSLKNKIKMGDLSPEENAVKDKT